MISLLKNMNMSRLVAAKQLNLPRFISTSDGVQNSEQMIKNVNEKIGLNKLSRTLSTVQNPSVPLASTIPVSKDENHEDFMDIFPDVIRDLSEYINNIQCHEAANWFAKVLQYNIPRGKKTRGMLTVLAYKNLVKPDQLTPENIKLAQYLGLCVEMLQGFLLIIDDMMDNSETRRGQPCWHVLEDVGLTAINDSSMIENSIYAILKKHFRQLDCYVDLLELFHDVTFITMCGESLDLLNANKSVNSFTMDNYELIAANKAIYSFYLPFALAMHLAGLKDAEAFRQAKTILVDMGHFFQVQDDFLDCFGNSEVTGKIGTDIQDNKCSWLAVVCMQRANSAQKAIMAECYGKNDPEKVSRVKELYKELDLPKAYATYEEEFYNKLKIKIQQTSLDVPHHVFLQFLNKINKRDF